MTRKELQRWIVVATQKKLPFKVVRRVDGTYTLEMNTIDKRIVEIAIGA